MDLYGIIVRNLKCLSIWGCFLTVAAQQTFLHFQSDCCSALVHIDCTDCTHVNVHNCRSKTQTFYTEKYWNENHKTIKQKKCQQLMLGIIWWVYMRISIIAFSFPSWPQLFRVQGYWNWVQTANGPAGLMSDSELKRMKFLRRIWSIPLTFVEFLQPNISLKH